MAQSVPPDGPTQTHPGRVAALLDRYQVLGVIGQGGMGTVYKGYHLSLKRPVAIKVLRIDQIKNVALVARFLREMHAIGPMDHPNVVRATDAGEKNGLFYLVMEYLEGQDLSRLLARRGRLGTADACELARQAALGLEYIHQTLVHRDIKPSNLLLTPAGVVKILDLGLARLHDADLADRERTPEGCTLGTFDYMAPEQAVGGRPVDGRTDIYSLGCTLFKFLTGRAPFTGPDYDSAARKLYAHGHVPLSALAAFATVPEELRPVLLRMTAKDPADRYPTAGATALALAPFAAGGQPAALLAGPEGDAAAVQPLPMPPPEELSRLTGPLTATRPNGPPMTQNRGRMPTRRRILAGVVVLAVVLAAAAWFLVPVLFPRPASVPPRGLDADLTARQGQGKADPVTVPPVRELDELEARTYHPLLDQPPVVIGAEAADPGVWRWDGGRQTLDVNGLDSLLFPLGTTARSHFVLETGVTQVPWTGNVGVFWGYHEDAAAKSGRRPNTTFAWFQLLWLWHGTDAKGGNVYVFERGEGAAVYTARGDIEFIPRSRFRQNIAPLIGAEKILQIEIEHDSLRQASFDGVPLDRLCTAEINVALKSLPYGGTLGLITLSHHAVFSNARYFAYSRN